MYARLILFKLDPLTGATAQHLTDRLAPLLKLQPGLVASTFIANDSTGEYGVLNVWASEADIDAEATLIVPRWQDALASLCHAPPTIYVFQVYEPRV